MFITVFTVITQLIIKSKYSGQFFLQNQRSRSGRMGIQITFAKPLSFWGRSIINNKLFWSSFWIPDRPFLCRLLSTYRIIQPGFKSIVPSYRRIEGLESQPEFIRSSLTKFLNEQLLFVQEVSNNSKRTVRMFSWRTSSSINPSSVNILNGTFPPLK